jgi:hypothetical protein
MGSKMQDSVSKAERYRKEAIKYGELSKSAQPAYLGDVYRKVAVRYAFMAEDLLRRSEHRRGPDLWSRRTKRRVWVIAVDAVAKIAGPGAI